MPSEPLEVDEDDCEDIAAALKRKFGAPAPASAPVHTAAPEPAYYAAPEPAYYAYAAAPVAVPVAAYAPAPAPIVAKVVKCLHTTPLIPTNYLPYRLYLFLT